MEIQNAQSKNTMVKDPTMSNQEFGGTLTDKKTVNNLYSDRENVIITSIVLIFHIQSKYESGRTQRTLGNSVND